MQRTEVNTVAGAAILHDGKVVLLSEILSCDYTAGKLYWKSRPHSMFSSDAVANRWNARYSGMEAMTANCRGYKIGDIFDKAYRAHRVVVAMATGSWPDEQVDHINGVRADNSIVNLRKVSSADNRRNTRIRIDNKSGVMGVCWSKHHSRWMVHVGKKYIGVFSDKGDAIRARQTALVGMGFHENHGRKHVILAEGLRK